ncbi:hypothetical protein BYT27DRAFT_6744839 [Phlegmacium glaucopus]|nr:hypothetical protein BYT27DRAFT_6744839 [Phlegmacium glaucopus]
MKRTCSITSVLTDIPESRWAIFQMVVMVILTVVAILISVGLIFGVIASTGAITMLIGNSILRATHHAHYTSNASAAYIGAVGSLLVSSFIAALSLCIPNLKKYTEGGLVHWLIQICLSVLVSTLSGTIGCTILLYNHVDLGGIDVLHATYAGAVGGAIFTPGMIFAVVSLVIAFILSPFWVASSWGSKRLWGGSSESLTDSHYAC